MGKPDAGAADDAVLSVNADGTVRVFSGKVDLGTGARIAWRQMAAEELDVPVDAIELIEGDTALTPDQGSTAGSQGITRGGVEIRRAAATARQALVRRASERLGHPVEALEGVDGVVRPRAGGPGGGSAPPLGGAPLQAEGHPEAAD